jgi:hypothetical protein
VCAWGGGEGGEGVQESMCTGNLVLLLHHLAGLTCRPQHADDVGPTQPGVCPLDLGDQPRHNYKANGADNNTYGYKDVLRLGKGKGGNHWCPQE